MSEALPLMLKELRLPAFGQYYKDYQDRASEHAWSYSQYLSVLCEQEVAQRFQSRISSWTHEAKLPRGKSFATLAPNDLPQAVQKKIIALRDNTHWAHQADNILLIGPSGVGKSHIAAALGLHLIEQGIRVKWITATALVQHLQQAKKDQELMTALTRMDKYRLMVLDDRGYVKKTY